MNNSSYVAGSQLASECGQEIKALWDSVSEIVGKDKITVNRLYRASVANNRYLVQVFISGELVVSCTGEDSYADAFAGALNRLISCA